MKRIAIIILAAVAALTSCKKTPADSIVLQEASYSNLHFNSAGGRSEITFVASGDWTVSLSGAPDWVSCYPAKGNSASKSFTVTVSSNGPESERSCVLTITCGTASQTINISQDHSESLSCAPIWVDMPKEGGQATVSVLSTSPIETSVTSGSDWLSVVSTKALQDYTLTLAAAANTTAGSRTGKVEVTSNGLSTTVTVMQVAGRTSTFDEGSIVASFGVMSDTHLDYTTTMPQEKLTKAFEQLKNRALINDNDGLDGILVAGDLIQNAVNTTEINSFKTTYENAFTPSKVPMVYCLGNHDVTGWWSTSMVTDGQAFRSIFGSDYYTTDQDPTSGTSLECRHCVIRGINILCISPIGNTPVIYDAKATAWLDAKLAELTAANPDRYIILLNHAMIQNTVYGSNLVSGGYESSDPSVPSYWYTSSLTSILNKYPQVITFGGHLHFPINDPRSIWQGGFTALGCASVRYMAFEGGTYYANKAGSTTLNDCNDYSQGYLIQFDASGNMRATRMDFFHEDTIGDPWVISYPDPTGKTHLNKYNHDIQRADDVAPVLTTLEVSGSTAKWAAATDSNDGFVHHYELSWTNGAGTTNTVWIMADYYLNPKPSTMKKEWEYSLGTLGAGTWTVTLSAVDAWGLRSNVLTQTVKN